MSSLHKAEFRLFSAQSKRIWLILRYFFPHKLWWEEIFSNPDYRARAVEPAMSESCLQELAAAKGLKRQVANQLDIGGTWNALCNFEFHKSKRTWTAIINDQVNWFSAALSDGIQASKQGFVLRHPVTRHLFQEVPNCWNSTSMNRTCAVGMHMELGPTALAWISKSPKVVYISLLIYLFCTLCFQ